MRVQLQELTLEKMDYQKKLVRKEFEIKTLAERIIAAQENFSSLLYDQINYGNLKKQQEVLDTHHASIADHSDVDSLIVHVQKEMQPFKCGRVFPEPPPSANETIAGVINKATRFITLISGLIAGPAVSLNGSPTVSPTIVAACASEFFPP